MKMIKIINKKSYIKITISIIKMYIDFWDKFFIDNIRREYVYFVSFINKIIERTMIRFIVFKIEIYDFLIHEIRHLLIKDKKSIMCIRIDNALKYIKRYMMNIVYGLIEYVRNTGESCS